jgi:hypothetical protein
VKPRPIFVRLDLETSAALRLLTKGGRSQSAAIRDALLEAARPRDSSVLSAEAIALATDVADRAEIADVAAVMGSLRADR